MGICQSTVTLQVGTKTFLSQFVSTSVSRKTLKAALYLACQLFCDAYGVGPIVIHELLPGATVVTTTDLQSSPVRFTQDNKRHETRFTSQQTAHLTDVLQGCPPRTGAMAQSLRRAAFDAGRRSRPRPFRPTALDRRRVTKSTPSLPVLESIDA